MGNAASGRATGGDTRPGRRFRALLAASLKAQRAALVLAALALVGVVATELLAPWPLKIIFDHILLGRPLPGWLAPLQPLLDLGPWPALLLSAAAIAGLALVSGALAYLQLYTSAQVGHRITWQLRGALFAHLQRLSLAHHRAQRTGELITKVAGDTNLLREMFSDWALTLLRHGATLLAMLGVMFMLHPPLAWVVSATLPPLLLLIYRLNRRVKDSARQQRQHEGAMASRLHEVLSSMALIQAFGRQSFEEGRFRAEIEANYRSGMRSTRATGAVVKAIAVVSSVGTAITVLLGAREVLAGALSPGELLVFITYVTSLYKPVRDLGKLAGKFARASVSARRVAQILDIAPDADDPPDARPLVQPLGEIVFEDVSFGHRPGQPLFEHLNLRIAAGEHVALIGPSGAGKSSLVHLLLRLAEPSTGRILIDGIDIRRCQRASLAQAIGFVPQDSLVLAVSARENITYGRPDAPEAEIEAAARAARAHEFIARLPQGYDTELGERGATLSGGQRQRLSLARALVKQPAILLMDEPTAAVDPHSARLIHGAVAETQRGRTLLVIGHDLRHLQGCDRVLRLADGRITELDAAERARLLADGHAPGPRAAALALVEKRHA